MNAITLFYVLNATLLILHEIESAYEKEWEIIKLPGKITGFLLMHIPILLIMFYGLLEISKPTEFGIILGFFSGLGGLAPLIVHKLLLRKNDRFNLIVSNMIIYLSALSGLVLFVLSVFSLVRF